MQYIIVNADGLITNIVEYDGEAEWSPGDGLTVEPVPKGAEVGGTYIGGVVTAAPIPEPTPKPKTFEQLVTEATSFDELKALVLANTPTVPAESSV